VADHEWWTYDDFAGRLGEVFDVPTDGRTVSMTLVEASQREAAGGRGPDGQHRRQFSLVFAGPGEPVLPQSVHRLIHADLGELDLFLVPIGPDADRMQYEAAFA
jgi:hypothetical protein